MSLLSLPPESILQIVEFIHDKKTLTALSKVCHRLHELVEARLYSKFKEDDLHNVGRLSQFLRTIMNNASLARHVKTLMLCKPDYPECKLFTTDFIYDPCNYGCWSSLRPRLEAYFTDSTSNAGEYWSYGKATVAELANVYIDRLNESYCWDYMAASLIIMLQSLESLTVIRFDNEKASTILSVLHIASFSQRHQDSAFKLPMLNEISLAAWYVDGDMQYHIYDIVPLLEMPSLKKFSCEGISNTKMIENVSPCNLTSLTLEKCGLPSNELERIIENCGQLQVFKFSYDWCGQRSGFGSSNLFHGLLSSQDHLKTISIVDKCEQRNSPRGRTYTEPLPCLAGFTKLVDLEISNIALLGKRILVSAADNQQAGQKFHSEFLTKSFALNDLPASLIRFTIDSARQNILELFNSYEFDHPSLKSIHVKWTERPERSTEENIWHDLYMKYDKHGIALGFSFLKMGEYSLWYPHMPIEW